MSCRLSTRVEGMVRRLEHEADFMFAQMDTEGVPSDDPEIVRCGTMFIANRAAAAELRAILKETKCQK